MSHGVGNDVVDLDEARAPAPRLLERVLCAEEQALWRQAADPLAFYWQLWAAKETAYKALARTEPQLVFSPAALRVLPQDETRAQVQHRSGTVFVRWSWQGRALTCAGLCAPWPDHALARCTETVRDAAEFAIPLTALELESVYSVNSRAARILGKRLCSERLGVETHRLQIVRPVAVRAERQPVRRGAPEVWLDGARCGSVQLSLSHHGRFAGCALAWS